jgi:LemA protein
MELQSELSDTESKIAYARQFYNSNVLDYNTKIRVFPNVLLAGAFGFQPADFFQAEGEARADVRVNFTQ